MLSLEQIVLQIRDIGLIPAERLDAFLKNAALTATPSDAQGLVQEFVRSGDLTEYQAAAILRGETRKLTRGDYVILERIGAGGMGEVLKARHRRLKRVVALKVLAPSAVESEAAIKRFLREVEAVARLNHPNIVTAFDAQLEEGVPYLVMEFVEGSDLSRLVKNHGPLPVERAVDYVLQAARGLEHAHAQGVIHRDIKPANLLLAIGQADKQSAESFPAGVVKILDMGLARFHEAAARETAGLTNTGSVMGTVDYMSPEQAIDTKSADQRSDIYSLGCTLWFLLTARPLYQGDTLMNRMLAHRDAPIPSLTAVRSDCPQPLESLFRRMVAKSVADRPQSMTEAVRELERVLASRAPAPVSSRPAVNSIASAGGSRPQVAVVPATEDPAIEATHAGERQTEHETVAGTVFEDLGDAVHQRRSSLRSKRGAAGRRWLLFGALGVSLMAGAAIWPLIKEKPKRIDSGSVAKPDQKPSSESAAATDERKSIDLLQFVDYERDAVGNADWQSEEKVLVYPDQAFQKSHGPGHFVYERLQIPYRLPREYILDLELERMHVEGEFSIGLSAGRTQFAIVLDRRVGDRTFNGFDYLDGLPAHENPLADSTRLLALRRPCSIRITVKKSSVVVKSEERQILEVKDLSRLASMHSTDNPLPRDIAFLVPTSPRLQVHKLRMTPLSGEGRPISFTPAESDLNRHMAELVVWKGGGVKLDGDEGTSYKYLEELPAEPFRLTMVYFVSMNKLLPRGLRQVADLESLTALRIVGRAADDDDLVAYCKSRKLKHLEIDGVSLTDDAIAHLADLSDLEYLSLGSSEMSDSGLKALARLPRLKALDLFCDTISGTGFAEFRNAPNLRAVALHHCDLVSDEGFAALGTLQMLDSVLIQFSAVNDERLKSLSRIRNLRSLTLDGTAGITEEGISTLAEMPQLVTLSLADVVVTDSVAEAVSRIPRLESLGFYASKISESGLEHLHSMSTLRDLFLFHVRPSAEALARLKTALPQCRIHQ